MSMFEELKAGLEEAIAHQRGKKVLTLRDVTAIPAPPRYSARAIKRIRTKRFHASQAVFARLLNVSPQTVRAWEGAWRSPDAATLKLLQLADRHPELFTEAAAP